MKLTAAVWALLPAAIQSTFTPNADSSEYDNGEESAPGLKTALDKEKAEKKALADRLSGFEADKLKEIEAARKKALDEARTSGDFKAVEDDYKRQLKELRDANDKSRKDAEERTKSDAINKHVEELAKLFVSPGLAKAAIKSRLTAELVDGEPIVRVLTADGKASAKSVEDLRTEFLTDRELKGSLVASKGSGGGSGHPTGGGGSGSGDETKFDAANAAPKDMIARLEAKGIGGGDDE